MGNGNNYVLFVRMIFCFDWRESRDFIYRISGRHPYIANDERRLLEVIRSQKLRFDSEKFRNLSPEGLDFLQGMIVYDTVHRRTMGELTVHRWLTVYFIRIFPFDDIFFLFRVDPIKNRLKI
jgi:serine/threonine protein kinase